MSNIHIIQNAWIQNSTHSVEIMTVAAITVAVMIIVYKTAVLIRKEA